MLLARVHRKAPKNVEPLWGLRNLASGGLNYDSVMLIQPMDHGDR
jgi:hypothetical protein